MGKIVGLTYNLKSDWKFSPDDPVDANAEFDGPATVESITRSLTAHGYIVVPIGNVENLLKRIQTNDLKVDIVFNIAEGQGGRNRESQVPNILEMYGIPFVGADALTLGITLDKVIAKKCFIADGIPTARYIKARSTDDVDDLRGLKFPMMVKTSHEGTSKGITKNSRVENMDQLKTQVEMINTVYKQPALVEEFISGEEYTVAVLGNNPPKAMPVVQYQIGGNAKLGNQFYSFELIQNKSVKYICPAPISKELEQRLQDMAVKAFQSVDCRDLGRVDFRVDDKGNPYVLEINPLPNLSEDEVFALFCKYTPQTYEQTINSILEYALDRYGLLGREVASIK